MAQVSLDGTVVTVEEGQTVLEALLAGGEQVPHSCNAGSCQSCMMRMTEGQLSGRSQQGLKPTLREQGYFLACMERPTEDLHVSLGEVTRMNVPAEVTSVTPLSPDVVQLTVKPREQLNCRPGQFVNLVRREDDLVRSYSIASVPGWAGARLLDDAAAVVDDRLEMHVRKIPGGRMSTWIVDELLPGEELDLRGPAGDCFYVPGEPDQPLLLAGTGTGLAPLWAIARDALSHQHIGPIVLYHGARDREGLYLVDELKQLAATHANVTYRRCLLDGEADERDVTIGRLDQALFEAHPDLTGWRVFLCGDPGLVNAMRKRAFLAGASMQAIHADAFVTAGTATPA